MISRTLIPLAAMILSLIAPDAGANVPIRSVKTFDGQIMTCNTRADSGRVAYRVSSQQGLIKSGNLEVTIEFETLKCVESAGILGFEKASLDTRVVNRLNGFVEFSTLELVGYTPDFKVMKVQALNLNSNEHRVTFVAPVNAYVGLLPRNANSNGGRRVAMLILLRGQANLGDARTGRVQDRTLVSFGAYSVFLSEQESTLAFASQL